MNFPTVQVRPQAPEGPREATPEAVLFYSHLPTRPAFEEVAQHKKHLGHE